MNYVRKRESKEFTFSYYKNGKKVVNPDVLNRIKKLNIPPAWENVTIADSETDYLQATGIDSKNRTQYIYHPMWIAFSHIEKYGKMKIFSKKLEVLMTQITKQLSSIKLDSKEYIIILIIYILHKTHSRIGSDYFVEENNTYGLTTITKKHVKINGDKVVIKYLGKKNIVQEFTLSDKLCSKVLSLLKKIPGDRLFKTTKGEIVTGGEINSFIKKSMNYDFTAKDFRTYAANKLYIECLKKNPIGNKKVINVCYDSVAEELGHTRSVCKSSYVMSIIPEIYLEDPEAFLRKKDPLGELFDKYKLNWT